MLFIAPFHGISALTITDSIRLHIVSFIAAAFRSVIDDVTNVAAVGAHGFERDIYNTSRSESAVLGLCALRIIAPFHINTGSDQFQ